MYNDPFFWAAAFGAAVIRAAVTTGQSLFAAVVEIFIAVFSAWAFTPVIIYMLHKDTEVWAVPVASLVALTASGVVRAVVTASNKENVLGFVIKFLSNRK